MVKPNTPTPGFTNNWPRIQLSFAAVKLASLHCQMQVLSTATTLCTERVAKKLGLKNLSTPI